MSNIKRKKGGFYLVLIGAFLTLSGFTSISSISADTPIEQMAIWGPFVLSGGLALIAIGLVLVVLIYMVD